MTEPGQRPDPGQGPRRGLSLRGRLLIITLLPMLVLTPILLGITIQRWLMRTDQILAARVASDLTVGRQYLDHLIANTRQEVAAFGRSVAFRDAGIGQSAADGVRPAPSALMREARRAARLDFLILTGGQAQVLAASPPTSAHEPLHDVLASGKSGLAVLPPQTLARISPQLARRALLPLIATEGSQPRPERVEDRGLVVLASVPVTLADGTPGMLIGGIMLNRNDGFIDRISELVYPATNPALTSPAEAGQQNGQPNGLTAGADLGVITLFLGDTRIATTLRPSGDERALGTRVSAEVAARVLEGGNSWHDTAFVVNGWFISAYEPLLDVDGARVGMLYAGIPKEPYTQARRVTFLMIGAAFLLVGGLFVPLALSWARGIFRPVAAISDTIAQVGAGDMSARSGALQGAAEITSVADHLDHLLALLESRERELRSLNQDLNARVEARTADLTRANQALEVTSRQLILAEKLATIGEVTAGVAHEINNPLAVISGNLEVVRMVLAEREPEAETELSLIDGQIRRINGLVTQLLQFARPEEFTGSESADPKAAIEGLRPLVRHMLARGQVQLQEDLSATRRIRMNPHELQQVLINLIANAVQAMPEGGQITLTLTDDDTNPLGQGISLVLTDSGKGMDEATLSRMFEPFFTTRGRDGGTGLGLPICLSLVTRQGGSLSASSQPGQGTSFHIWLPADPGMAIRAMD
ncbi:sensor histidine kinase [Pseudogemmobacter hezensis]|uniref:sensor histidine kinase n=1 Tax=Pseudogemmobacter hezensis TaxID=2737662 RepID=UPI0020A6923D|nr:ATP-binding protein [Pseudogemmobacter hezensis]